MYERPTKTDRVVAARSGTAARLLESRPCKTLLPFPPVESVRIRDPCPFRAGVGESTQKIDRSDSFVEMIRLSVSLDEHAVMESERTGFGGAKYVIAKEKVQNIAPLVDIGRYLKFYSMYRIRGINIMLDIYVVKS